MARLNGVFTTPYVKGCSLLLHVPLAVLYRALKSQTDFVLLRGSLKRLISGPCPIFHRPFLFSLIFVLIPCLEYRISNLNLMKNHCVKFVTLLFFWGKIKNFSDTRLKRIKYSKLLFW